MRKRKKSDKLQLNDHWKLDLGQNRAIRLIDGKSFGWRVGAKQEIKCSKAVPIYVKNLIRAYL